MLDSDLVFGVKHKTVFFVGKLGVLCRALALCVGPRRCIVLNLKQCTALHVCWIAVEVSDENVK